jgi:hypothetical protein
MKKKQKDLQSCYSPEITNLPVSRSRWREDLQGGTTIPEPIPMSGWDNLRQPPVLMTLRVCTILLGTIVCGGLHKQQNPILGIGDL